MHSHTLLHYNLLITVNLSPSLVFCVWVWVFAVLSISCKYCMTKLSDLAIAKVMSRIMRFCDSGCYFSAQFQQNALNRYCTKEAHVCLNEVELVEK